MNLFEKGIELVFGSKHERDVKRMRPMVEAINAREAEIEALDDEALGDTGNDTILGDAGKIARR